MKIIRCQALGSIVVRNRGPMCSGIMLDHDLQEHTFNYEQ